MALWKYAFRELVRRRGRSALTLIGVAVGVATAVATWVTAETAGRGYRDLFDALAGPACLEVCAPGDAGFDPTLAAGMATLPGVRAAIPQVQSTASLMGACGPLPVIVVGRAADAIDTGACLPAEGESLVGAALAESAGLHAGDRVRLWGPGGVTELVVAGRLPASASAGPAAMLTVVTPLATAQRLFALGAGVNRVRLLLADGADPRRVEAEARSRLPPGLRVCPPAAHAEIGQGLRAAAEQGLAGLTAVAVAGAGLVVLNVFRLNLQERCRELAVLRTLGASRRQVGGLFLRQALLLGFAGWVLGTAAGLALASAAVRGMGAGTGVRLAGPAFGWRPVLVGLAVGVGIAVVAVWLPARRYCRRTPLELFRSGTGRPRSGVWRGQVVGLLLAAAAGAALASPALARLPADAGRQLFPAALALLVGAATVAVGPAFPRVLGRMATPARLAFGVAGTLAVRQLARRPDRTARTTAVVFVAVVLAVGFGHTVLNTLADVRGWCRRAIPADFLVRGSTPDPTFLLAAALPEEIGGELRRLGGVEAVDKIAFIPTDADGTPALVLAGTFPPDRPLPLDLRRQDPDAVRAALLRGEAVLGDGLARALGVGVGSGMSLATPHGPRTLRVAGTVTEYAAGGLALYLAWDAAASLFGPTGVHAFLVTARPGEVETVRAALGEFCVRRGLLLQSNDAFRRTVDGLTRSLTAALWALLALVFGVAGLGVAGAVAAGVREQAREFDVLRAVGMRRGPVRLCIRLQAVFLAVLALPAGAVVGLAVSLALNHAVEGLWGYRVPYRVQWELLAGIAALAVLAGLGASAVPAARRPVPSGGT